MSKKTKRHEKRAERHGYFTEGLMRKEDALKREHQKEIREVVIKLNKI